MTTGTHSLLLCLLIFPPSYIENCCHGVSILDSPDGLFWWPEADAALFDAIQLNARADIPVEVVEANINDDAFAEAVTERLLGFLR